MSSKTPVHLALVGTFLLALPAQAAVTGPISGGEHGRPFTSATFDLAPYGYVEEEFFFDGEAVTYGSAGGRALTINGRWRTVPTGSLPFKSRLLVRRPADPALFNGTVLVEWMNVTGGYDIDAVWARVSSEALRSGYAWVGVSAQRAAVNGPPVLAGVSQPLVDWDPGRYGSLLIPDDAASYDVFAQGAALVGPDRVGTPDPLGGLPVRRVLAIGASQSAHRLASYIDGVHHHSPVVDGYLIVGRFGRGASLATGVDPPNPLRIRTDLDVPVFTVNSESEALAHFRARQPDTDRLRYWEVAAAAHQDTYVDAVIDAQLRRDLDLLLPPCDPPANSMPFQYVLNAALDHLNRWNPDAVASPVGSLAPDGARRAIASRHASGPPSLPLIAVSGNPPEIERDAYGNARGGIRLPQLVAATAQYGPVGSPEALRCDLRGFTLPFSDEDLAELYPDHRVYVNRVRAATLAAERAGFLLRPDGEEIRREAVSAPIP
ncbi:MAG: hypothetical protein FJ144_17410 [Deltaproteobacteria bacterium]|nr:hypothetical protein [Deltaproteobacteria bacterium]